MTVCSPTKASSVAVNSAFPMFVRGHAGSFEGELIIYFAARVSTILLIMRGVWSMVVTTCVMMMMMLLSTIQNGAFSFSRKCDQVQSDQEILNQVVKTIALGYQPPKPDSSELQSHAVVRYRK